MDRSRGGASPPAALPRRAIRCDVAADLGAPRVRALASDLRRALLRPGRTGLGEAPCREGRLPGVDAGREATQGRLARRPVADHDYQIVRIPAFDRDGLAVLVRLRVGRSLLQQCRTAV